MNPKNRSYAVGVLLWVLLFMGVAVGAWMHPSLPNWLAYICLFIAGVFFSFVSEIMARSEPILDSDYPA